MPGGNGSRKRKGDRLEAAVVKDWERRPDTIAFRARQGGGEIVDVVALQKCSHCTMFHEATHAYLIQCRSSGKMSGIEREQLIERANLVSAHPFLAFREGRTIQYREVRR